MSGNELLYISQSVTSGKISGDGLFTKKCHQFLKKRYGFPQALLTTSCTDALEMASILVGIQNGDEVICPSYTFVSTINAFVLRGAKPVFIDSCSNHPNLDVKQIEAAITSRTKAILVVHYAGVAVDMDEVMLIAKKHDLYVVEDAAQAIESFYKGKPLGTFGDISTFSFHETKNIISGEGGLFVSNNNKFFERAEIIREKGTNRSAFFRGEVDKYSWVDIGSSFLPSDIISAFLFAQLESVEFIQKQRVAIWESYFERLQALENIGVLLPKIPTYATNNAHCFYLICRSLEERTKLIEFLKQSQIMSVFHYVSLHKSAYFLKSQPAPHLPNCDLFADRLVRLPLYVELTDAEVENVSDLILKFYGLKN